MVQPECEQSAENLIRSRLHPTTVSNFTAASAVASGSALNLEAKNTPAKVDIIDLSLRPTPSQSHGDRTSDLPTPSLPSSPFMCYPSPYNSFSSPYSY